MPSLLAIVQEDQALLEQLQINISDGTSEKSALASISNLSSSIHSLSSSRVTYVLERSKNWGKEKEEVVELVGNYPEPLSTALNSIAVITRDWRALSALEEEMAKPFNNISDQAAQTVNLLTREKALIDAIGCANLTNLKGGDYYGRTAGWLEEKKLRLGTFLLFKAFKIFLQEGERQIRPVDLRPS